MYRSKVCLFVVIGEYLEVDVSRFMYLMLGWYIRYCLVMGRWMMDRWMGEWMGGYCYIF